MIHRRGIVWEGELPMSGPATVQDSLIGLEFGHYRILERIGSGGMGVVYRGYDAHLDREVAIKVLNPGTIADDHSRKDTRKSSHRSGNGVRADENSNDLR